MAGTFNLARTIWDDPSFRDEPFTEREAYIWLIGEASWKAREKRAGNHIVKLERGQLVAAVRYLAKAWKWEKSKVERFLKKLTKRDKIKTDSSSGISIITVCNYSEDQNTPTSQGKNKNPKTRQKRDSGETNKNKGLIPEGTHKKDTELLFYESPGGTDVSEALLYFNQVAERVGWPKVQKETLDRKTALELRMNDAGGLDNWRSAIDRAAQAPHLIGQNRIGWTANFDWLAKSQNFTKLMEGNYDERSAKKSISKSGSPSRPSSDDTIRAIIEAAAGS